MKNLFHAQINQDVYLLSCTSYGTCMEFGPPTANSYLIIGQEQALLFDLAVDAPGLRQYAEALAQKPLITVVSHGHPDHIFHIDSFDALWLHEADWDFPLCALAGVKLPEKLPQLHPVTDGMCFDLGGRVLDVIAIPGHTLGSILLFDRQTGILFSGDTVARRLLYGLTGCPPLPAFMENLNRLRNLPIREIYSAHDRAALPPDYPSYMIEMLQAEMPHASETWQYPGFPQMRRLVVGDEASAKYFDAAIPEILLNGKDGKTHAL